MKGNLWTNKAYEGPTPKLSKKVLRKVAADLKKNKELSELLAKSGKKVPTVQKSFMKRFVLERHEDETGTSGVGTVAEGVVFSNGKVALTWFSHYGAVNVYDSIQVVEVLHGHGGKTKIIWTD
jgi:hypothetical protein